MKECINNQYSPCTEACDICHGTNEMSHLQYFKSVHLSHLGMTIEMNRNSRTFVPAVIYISFRNALEEYLKKNNLPDDYITFNRNYKGEGYTFEKVFDSVRQNYYIEGEKVQVIMSDAKIKNQWRDAVVTGVQWQHQTRGASYPMVMVEVMRTYCNGVWNPETLETDLTFFEKLNTEGIVYMNQIRPRRCK